MATQKGSYKGIVAEVNENGFKCEGKGWVNYTKPDYRKDPFHIPAVGDFVEFDWSKSEGYDATFTNKIKALSQREPLTLEEPKEPTSGALPPEPPHSATQGTKPSLKDVNTAVREAKVTVPYGCVDLDDYIDKQLTRDIHIAYSVALKEATNIVIPLLIHNVGKAQVDIDAAIAMVNDTTITLLMNLIDNEKELKSALALARKGEPEEPEDRQGEDTGQQAAEGGYAKQDDNWGNDDANSDIPF